MTNATKAGIIAAVNALLMLAVAFDIALTETQIGAIGVALNAALSLYVGLTYQNSPARDPQYDA
jgi:hypothetical protein